MSEFHGTYEPPPRSFVVQHADGCPGGHEGGCAKDPRAPATVEHEFIPGTAWQSVPGAVRFAVWLWAVSSIVGFTVGVAALVAFAAGWLS